MKDLNSAGVTGAGTTEFKVLIKSGSNATGVSALDSMTASVETTFNFDRSSSKYIRKVFNTNPTLINSDVTRRSQIETYWL